VTRSGESLEGWVVARLAEHGLSLTTAESCTGGLLASLITDISGASAVYKEGFVAYSNEAKKNLLHVEQALLDQYGAVSENVSKAMAEGALKLADSDFALAVTGIAGPGGSTPDKPVGLVFISLARRGKETICRECRFSTDRLTFKKLSTQTAFDMLRRELISQF
jgi:PncC family amidohydrolase